MAVLKNRAGMNTTTVGTGTVTLGSALTIGTVPFAAGWQSLAAAGVANGDQVRYLILDNNLAWEYGVGTYTAAGTTLSRPATAMDGTVPGQKSSTGALLSLSGNAQVFVSVVAEDLNSVLYDTAQILTAPQQQQARQNVYAAPFDAMMFNGMQINGSCVVSQENGSTAGTGNGYCPVDGAIVLKVGTMGISVQRVTDAPPGFRYSVKFSITTAQASLGAGDYCLLRTAIEGNDFWRCKFGTANAQPVSIVFWVKAHRTGNYTMSVQNGAVNRSYVTQLTVNAVDTWERKVVTIPGDVTGTWAVDNTVGFYVSFSVAIGSTFSTGGAGVWGAGNFLGLTGGVNGVAATTDTFQVGGFLIFPGNETPNSTYEVNAHRGEAEELRRAMRYWQLVYVNIATWHGDGNAYGWPFALPVTMRAIPTIDSTGIGIGGAARLGGYPTFTMWSTAALAIGDATAVASNFTSISGTMKLNARI